MPLRHIQSKEKIEAFRESMRQRKKDIVDDLGEGTRADPRTEVMEVVQRIKSNIRIRKERNITVRSGKKGGVKIGSGRYSHSSSDAVGKIRTTWSPMRNYEKPWKNRSYPKHKKIARKEREKKSLERYMQKRHEATLEHIRLMNALSLRPNHRLIKMQAEIAARKPVVVGVKDVGRAVRKTFRRGSAAANASAALRRQQKNARGSGEENLPHFMTNTESYATELESKNAMGKRKNLEGRPTLREMREIFRDADTRGEGALDPSVVSSLFARVDLVTTPNDVVEKCKLTRDVMRRRRRQTLSYNLPDSQAGTSPAYLRSRPKAIPEEKLKEEIDDGKVGMETFLRLYDRLCAEQPLQKENPWSESSKNADAKEDGNGDVISNERKLIRMEDKWNTSTEVPKFNILRHQTYSRRDVYTHQPVIKTTIPTSSSLDSKWRTSAQLAVNKVVEEMKRRGDLLPQPRDFGNTGNEAHDDSASSSSKRVHDSELHSAVSHLTSLAERNREANEERRQFDHTLPGWKQLRQMQDSIRADVSEVVRSMNLGSVEHLDFPDDTRRFVKSTHGFVPKEPIKDPSATHRLTRERKKRRAVPRRYRESNDIELKRQQEMRASRIESAEPPDDYWGLYRDPAERRAVLVNDTKRHLLHDLERERRALPSAAPISPDKLLGGERAVQAVRNHLARQKLLAASKVSDTQMSASRPHAVMEAHDPNYKNSRDKAWASQYHHYLTPSIAWKAHLKAGLSRHEDASMLMLEGSQHILSPSDATAGAAWRRGLNDKKHSSAARSWDGATRSSSHHVTLRAEESRRRHRDEEVDKIAEKYSRVLDKLGGDFEDETPTAEELEMWRAGQGNQGRRNERIHRNPDLALRSRDADRTQSETKSEMLSDNRVAEEGEGVESSTASVRMLSPEERQRRRLRLAAARAKRHETEAGGFKGLTSRAEAERIGNMNNVPRRDWDAEDTKTSGNDANLLSPQERRSRRLRLAAARAKRHEAEAGGFHGLTADEAEAIGNANNRARVDWDTERFSFAEEFAGTAPISPEERERRRLSGARERAKRHEAEGGSFRGLQDRAQAEEIGKAMNYSPRKGIAFDMFPKDGKTSE